MEQQFPRFHTFLQQSQVFLETINKLTEQAIDYDCVVISATGDRFPAHRQRLSWCSSVFSATLDSEVQPRYELSVNGDSESVFRVLEFVYTDYVDANIDSIGLETLLRLAAEYDIVGLKTMVGFRLAKMLSVSNVVHLVLVSRQWQAATLRTACLRFLAANVLEVEAAQPRWRELVGPENVKQVNQRRLFATRKRSWRFASSA